MTDKTAFISMDVWISRLRSLFTNMEHEYSELFEIYAAEARFGRQYILNDTEQLTPGAKILEVGAGSMILSCQLVNEGYNVTSIEPVESGFSHFRSMQQIILEQAKVLGCMPVIISDSAENFIKRDEYDYAFSINVMEHVGDVSTVLLNIAKSLVAGGCYRFTCPNYLFPYEPHFNIPTLFSKRLTEIIFKKSIYGNQTMSDPAGVWKSLNWITVSEIKNYVQNLEPFKVSFGRDLILHSIERMVSDINYSNRRSHTVRIILRLLLKSRLYLMFRYVPVSMQPIIDCRLSKVRLASISPGF